VQSDLWIYEGQTTQVEICHSKNVHEYFEVLIDESNGHDVLRAPYLPAGFACLIYCRKNSFHN
jgi:hypothetical protein